ncbi:MAG: hypothetical protein M0R21_03140 [Lentimicrobiaceae bacterium]|nr:hypothetical protein [Lentimicrobiaceae bacterium]
MRGRRFILIMLTMVVSGLIYTACSKDDNNTSSEAQSVKDFATAESIYDDVDQIAQEAEDGSVNLFKDADAEYSLLSNCVTITRDTVSVPHLITVDFGTKNCLCNDGKYRRGQILISYMGRHLVPGSYKNITFNGYYVNNNQVLGTKTITNMGRNSNEDLWWSIQVDGKIIYATGDSILWTSNRNRAWVEGEGTLHYRLDDVYSITGVATVTRPNGNIANSNIVTGLRKEMGCHNFVSGVVEIDITGKPTRTLDYGNGDCDNLATITINGKTFTIILK